MAHATVTAVLVLYQELVHDSACFSSLRGALRDEPSLADNLRVLLYDNSPVAQPIPELPCTLDYISDPANGGIAAAYNAGLERARAAGSIWLQLLDQDTVLTREYLQEAAALLPVLPEIAVAVVPRLVQDGATHSPSHLPRLSHRRLPEQAAGLLSFPVSVYNSGAFIRIAALRRFPSRYWLDFLDHATFHELQAGGGRVWLLHSRLPHQLSTQQLGRGASLARYKNVLQAERDFYREYGSAQDRVFHRLRRVKQALGQLLKVRDKRFAWLSLSAALGLLPRTAPRKNAPRTGSTPA